MIRHILAEVRRQLGFLVGPPEHQGDGYTGIPVFQVVLTLSDTGAVDYDTVAFRDRYTEAQTDHRVMQVLSLVLQGLQQRRPPVRAVPKGDAA